MVLPGIAYQLLRVKLRLFGEQRDQPRGRRVGWLLHQGAGRRGHGRAAGLNPGRDRDDRRGGSVIIDWHTHVYPPEAAAAPSWQGRCPMVLENVLDVHQRAGVDMMVVSNPVHYVRGKPDA